MPEGRLWTEIKMAGDERHHKSCYYNCLCLFEFSLHFMNE